MQLRACIVLSSSKQQKTQHPCGGPHKTHFLFNFSSGRTSREKIFVTCAKKSSKMLPNPATPETQFSAVCSPMPPMGARRVYAAQPLSHGAPSAHAHTHTMLDRGSTAAIQVAVRYLVFLLVWLWAAPIDSFVTQRAAGAFQMFPAAKLSEGGGGQVEHCQHHVSVRVGVVCTSTCVCMYLAAHCCLVLGTTQS